jgi:hypothetical protein
MPQSINGCQGKIDSRLTSAIESDGFAGITQMSKQPFNLKSLIPDFQTG